MRYRVRRIPPANNFYPPGSGSNPSRRGGAHGDAPNDSAHSCAVGEKNAVAWQCAFPSSHRTKTAIVMGLPTDSNIGWNFSSISRKPSAPTSHRLAILSVWRAIVLPPPQCNYGEIGSTVQLLFITILPHLTRDKYKSRGEAPFLIYIHLPGVRQIRQPARAPRD